MKWMHILVLGLVVVAGCRKPAQLEERETVEPPGPPRPLPEVGNCQNEHLDGTCKLMGIYEEESRLPEGSLLYRLWYDLETGEGEHRQLQNVYHVVVPEERKDDLVAYYEQNTPVACKAYIVRPPCNPDGTYLVLELEMPEYASKGRP
jgi:hypothetical protein